MRNPKATDKHLACADAFIRGRIANPSIDEEPFLAELMVEDFGSSSPQVLDGFFRDRVYNPDDYDVERGVLLNHLADAFPGVGVLLTDIEEKEKAAKALFERRKVVADRLWLESDRPEGAPAKLAWMGSGNVLYAYWGDDDDPSIGGTFCVTFSPDGDGLTVVDIGLPFK